MTSIFFSAATSAQPQRTSDFFVAVIVYCCALVRAADDQAIELDGPCGESFHCENSGGCIDQSQVCNFHTDCPLGEDEGFICGEASVPFTIKSPGAQQDDI